MIFIIYNKLIQINDSVTSKDIHHKFIKNPFKWVTVGEIFYPDIICLQIYKI